MLTRILLLFGALVLPAAAAAQDTFKPGLNITDTNPQPEKSMCWTGTIWAACSAANPMPVQEGPWPTGAAANQTQGTAANGASAASAGNPNVIAGSDGTNLRTLSTSTTGILNVAGQVSANGTVANGATDSGNPVKIGGVATSTSCTAVTAGQRVNACFGLNGSQAINLGGGSIAPTANPVALNVTALNDGTTRPLAVGDFMYDPVAAQLLMHRGDATGGLYTQERERSQFFAEAPGILAANAVFTGTTRDGGVSPSQWGTFSCFVNSDQASAPRLEGSPDGTTWTIKIAVNVAAATPTRITDRNDTRYSRCRLNNGTTPNTVAPVITSSFGN